MLPEQNAWVAITAATIGPYGDGVLLALDFRGKRGAFHSVSGRLYVVGIPVFDAENAELRVDKLEYTAATESVLLKSAEWLTHSRLLDAFRAAAIVKLGGELEEATRKAKEQMHQLQNKLPKEIAANVTLEKLSIERIAFEPERVFAIVQAKGRMSAQLKP